MTTDQQRAEWMEQLAHIIAGLETMPAETEEEAARLRRAQTYAVWTKGELLRSMQVEVK